MMEEMPGQVLPQEGAEGLANLSDEERIIRIQSDRWIGYPRAVEILKQMDNLMHRPKNLRTQHLLVVGHTNNGKSTIVDRFRKRYPPDDNPSGPRIILPVISIQAPPSPGELALFHLILDEFLAPYKPRDPISAVRNQVYHLLRTHHVSMLIVDDIHHILAGHLDKQQKFLIELKNLGTKLQIPIVGVGTEAAFRAIQADPQMGNRFKPAILQRWQMGTDFMRLLASFEPYLLLKKTFRLTETGLAASLLSKSEGLIGELSNLLNEAAIYAIDSGAETINHKVLDRVDWVLPSKRKDLAKKAF